LLLCDQATTAESRLAADISRCLSSKSRWAWPQQKAAGPTLRQTLDSCRNDATLTGILVFGQDLARLAFGAEIPASLHGAPVRVAPAMAALADQPDERLRCWRILQSLREAAQAARGR
jgi:hypothetical protein